MSTTSESLPRRTWRRYRSIPIIYRIAVAFVLGTALGGLVGERAGVLEPLGDLFLRLLEMLIVPLIVFTLLGGMRKLTPSKLGKVGGLTVGLYAVTTTIAAAIGLAVANLFDPGTAVEFVGGEAQEAEPPTVAEVVLGIVPENPLAAMVDGDILSTIFFVVVFGLALTMVREATTDETVADAIDGFFAFVDAGTEALFKIVWGVMEYGVIGVFALMAASIGTEGLGAIVQLGALVAVIAVGIVIHMSVTYLGVMTLGILGESPLSFLAGAKDAMVTAFTIRSSSGTLPVTIADADENLRIDESVYGFGLPLGATINMDGAAIRQAVTAVFAANLVGVTLGVGEQVLVLATVILISIGTAGVPGAGLIMLSVILTALGLPLEIVGFVAGVDPILGRIATTNNVTGDLAVASVVGKWTDGIDLSSGVWSDVPDEAAGEGGGEGVAAGD
ncbi:dicarboxylate/amino acid:cation symporter [Halobiforma lacisalsi AJ5]|uniref:Dicarboxylate/amino acid:cation symporter n=1 Tax=Natronobacterium lacisalsi AJ5 TaxID=358396 RepID=M0LUE6_NATLA|nr:dicarboxylate/amino acid:cation symporter [Halobiforma lacisalsi]APW97562.1 dicarboxylate/amino acid:cation symporter [Halobiforma lacisalsi AJ5]EMA37056.1 sodium:dicarboxylate symporter [Halobiforma lacisalsi AJ5]